MRELFKVEFLIQVYCSGNIGEWYATKLTNVLNYKTCLIKQGVSVGGKWAKCFRKNNSLFIFYFPTNTFLIFYKQKDELSCCEVISIEEKLFSK